MRTIVVAIGIGMGAVALGQDLFPAGSENKARGMESLVASERGSAVLYNPSNLTTTPGRRAYLEAGMINVNYAYEHPQFDPVVVKTNSPLVALGYGGQLRDNWYLGVMTLPTKGGQMDVPGVPRDVSGVVVPVAVRNEDFALKSGVGLGYKMSETWRFGLSLLHNFEHRSLTANVVGNPVEVINYDVYHQSLQPKLGARFKTGQVVVATAYSHGFEKRYVGNYQSASNPEEQGVPIRDYVPSQFGLGIAASFKRFTAEVDLAHDAWSAGSSVYRSGQGTATTSDLKNVVNWGTSLAYDTGRKLKFLVGYASKPSPWGDGQNTPGEEIVSGADFGLLNAIDRQTFSAGSQMVLSDSSRVEAAFYRSSGERETTGQATSVGKYQLAITAVTATISQQF